MTTRHDQRKRRPGLLSASQWSKLNWYMRGKMNDYLSKPPDINKPVTVETIYNDKPADIPGSKDNIKDAARAIGWTDLLEK